MSDGILPEKSLSPPSAVAAAVITETSLRTAGQRRVNVIWEYTQALVAGEVVTTVLIVSAWQSVRGTESLKMAAFGFLIGVANLVIGFYFGRTNHQRVGGIGGSEEIGGR
jgi:hypothetical protein